MNITFFTSITLLELLFYTLVPIFIVKWIITQTDKDNTFFHIGFLYVKVVFILFVTTYIIPFYACSCSFFILLSIVLIFTKKAKTNAINTALILSTLFNIALILALILPINKAVSMTILFLLLLYSMQKFFSFLLPVFIKYAIVTNLFLIINSIEIILVSILIFYQYNALLFYYFIFSMIFITILDFLLIHYYYKIILSDIHELQIKQCYVYYQRYLANNMITQENEKRIRYLRHDIINYMQTLKVLHQQEDHYEK